MSSAAAEDHSRATRGALWVVSLGLREYSEALVIQRDVARARITGAIPEDVLLLVEHPPVITLGRSSKPQHLVATADLLASRGIALHEVERGGDVTLHAPGQLVGYPIVDLKRHKQDLHWYLRQVEEALIRSLAPFGIAGERSAGYTGVWTQGRKLASIGVHARDWVTWHGFALNVSTDLELFDMIVPCGIRAVQMTSVCRECTAPPPAVPEVAAGVTLAFGTVFELEPISRELGDVTLTVGAN
ncbi:MAG: lipoyl(octanoyl) transferase LipB [Gemmatimonadaceae bacterium]|nr:lipoyl(octanoyl) transferase LipB [Gemmatimonadaceae bacterium]